MRAIASLFALLLAVSPAAAQMTSTGAGKKANPVTFQGPGDIVSGATAWGSCARAYNAAYANGTNPLCDLVDATTGAVAICTLRVATSGFVDLTGSYCTGSTTPAVACAAAAGGACKVTKVYDQTGNGHHWSTVTAAAMPALTFSALGGLPGMTCAASCVLPSDNITQAQPFTFSAVYERTSATTTRQNILSISGGTVFIGPESSVNTLIAYAGGAGLTVTANDNAFHATAAIFNNTSGVIVADGVATTGTIGTSALSATPLRVGSANGGGVGLTGTVMEVGTWSVAFNAAQYGNMNTNQHGTNGYNF